VILETQGRLKGLSRARKDVPRESGADFVDANGKLWDHKRAISNAKWDRSKFLDGIGTNDLRNGEDIILNVSELSPAELPLLQEEIRARGWTNRFILIR
jgi:hypothetical protein